jgi:hypothetical protein
MKGCTAPEEVNLTALLIMLAIRSMRSQSDGDVVKGRSTSSPGPPWPAALCCASSGLVGRKVCCAPEHARVHLANVQDVVEHLERVVDDILVWSSMSSTEETKSTGGRLFSLTTSFPEIAITDESAFRTRGIPAPREFVPWRSTLSRICEAPVFCPKSPIAHIILFASALSKVDGSHQRIHRPVMRRFLGLP